MTSIARAFAARTNRAMLTVGVGALIAIGAPIPAAAAPFAAPASAELRSEVKQRAGDLRRFYAARDYRPLWLSPSGQASSAVDRLLERLETAQFDALDKRTLKNLRTGSLRRDLDRAAGGKPEAIARADVELSQMFATYARAMRGAPRGRMLYESAALAPVMPTAESVLTSAAKSPSLDEHITQMAWMHPFYAELRDALISPGFSPNKRQVIWENLSRVRALPAIPAERYVLVDAASARLWMYENGKPVDSMKAVVGKPESETPAMAGFIRYAIVNPYWNVPPDLVQNTIAKGVLSGGTKYLTQRGYEVLANYDANAKPIDPKKVDWQAVAAGAPPPHVRQKPGGSNFMGKVKYEFPNAQGIYLHDTPDRALLKLDDRQLSNGCVRLEDADRLGRWLLGGKSVSKTGNRPEQRIDLPTVVPVYITYLTAAPDAKGTIAFRDDVYGRDSAPQFAALEGVSGAGAYPR
ncbi:L,D-transpeptidase family protein [Altererythrobacter sp. TH136]|uniref:L,D-transpeptidase family protein n=1 Tax=Altererythrobacter sp. TH136 TaxID=2067415 RepID=UPI001165B08D|nr:L,D-transpeptidase family protein [Altererythrobacter sp. TH136]QDM39707.1 L,D-transpeptidase family protein [Altererythrobacter sp. TH136]